METPEKTKKKRTQQDYNIGFKLAVISQVEKGEMTYKQAQQLYGIQGRSTVLVWLRKHGNLDWSKPGLLMKSKENPANAGNRKNSVPPAGFEPATPALGKRCSIP